jgi:hypothetical protein
MLNENGFSASRRRAPSLPVGAGRVYRHIQVEVLRLRLVVLQVKLRTRPSAVGALCNGGDLARAAHYRLNTLCGKQNGVLPRRNMTAPAISNETRGAEMPAAVERRGYGKVHQTALSPLIIDHTAYGLASVDGSASAWCMLAHLLRADELTFASRERVGVR